MKFLLASLALLPVIASHMFLQLPPLSASASSTGRRMPLGLRRQFSQHGHGSSLKDLQQQQKQSEEVETLLNEEPQYSQSEEDQVPLKGQRDSRSSAGQDLEGDWSVIYPSSLEPALEAISESKRSADYELALRIPGGFDEALSRRGGESPSPLLGYLLPSLQHTHSSRPLSSYPFRFSNGPIPQRRSSTPMASYHHRFGGSPPEGAKSTPTKRYLGIELPDYIASNYGADKSGNPKLHSLKQRMRSVGK